MEQRKFWFGKYKGRTIESICDLDLSYIDWCLRNVKGFTLTDEEKISYNASHYRSSLIRCPYDYDEGGVWDEFSEEMTFNMMNDFD